MVRMNNGIILGYLGNGHVGVEKSNSLFENIFLDLQKVIEAVSDNKIKMEPHMWYIFSNASIHDIPVLAVFPIEFFGASSDRLFCLCGSIGAGFLVVALCLFICGAMLKIF